MIKAGVLSDSHLHQISSQYRENCRQAFAECEIIIHAGDLTELSILSPFSDKKVYAVSGNMCSPDVQRRLPKKRTIEIEEVTIGISHGAGNRFNIEERVFTMFPDANCIVYGHTHLPVCHRYGPVLMVNPGSFQAVSRYGGPGSYAILTIDGDNISGKIHYLTP
ncbi:MAG: YfcE family phosphodiesterase [Deltaproteobacteria bacterium]|nr:MAG: YfcE family phosphodiesterase [Deltaproteobacteria bacterium]